MRDRLRRQEGQAMVEFVLILPLFVALVFIVIGFGITLNNYLRVTDVARVAARDGAIARFTGKDPCAVAVDAAQKAAGDLTFDDPAQPALCSTPSGNGPGQPITVTVKIKSQNALTNIPFLSLTLPSTLTSTATVLQQ